MILGFAKHPVAVWLAIMWHTFVPRHCVFYRVYRRLRVQRTSGTCIYTCIQRKLPTAKYDRAFIICDSLYSSVNKLKVRTGYVYNPKALRPIRFWTFLRCDFNCTTNCEMKFGTIDLFAPGWFCQSSRWWSSVDNRRCSGTRCMTCPVKYVTASTCTCTYFCFYIHVRCIQMYLAYCVMYMYMHTHVATH